MKRLAYGLVLASCLHSQTVAWTKISSVGAAVFGGYTQIRYTGLTHQVIMPLPGNAGISTGYVDSLYSLTVNAGTPASSTVATLGTLGDTANNCTATAPFTRTWTGSVSGTGPSQRHWSGTMWIDTTRNRLIQILGVCQNVVPTNMYYLQLASPLSTSTWHALSWTIPDPQLVNLGVGATGVYDPDDDVYFIYGYDTGAGTNNNWVGCPTDLNPIPGTLTAKQTAAGCGSADAWTVVSVVGGTQPSGSQNPGLVYDTINKKVVMFGGSTSGGTVKAETWAYDVPTKAWTNKSPSSPPVGVPLAGYWPALDFMPDAGLVWYHKVTRGGSGPQDWTYNLATNAWSLIGSGAGPDDAESLAYDANSRFVTMTAISGGSLEIWVGAIGSTLSITASMGGNFAAK